jgi:carbon-monoxide dehydrogenase medium subunit
VYVADIEVHQPTTLDEAAATLGRYGPDARLLAGGTDLLVDLKTGRVRVGHLVSINRIEALRTTRQSVDGLHIGALTTISELTAFLSAMGGEPGQSLIPNPQSPVAKPFASLLDATREMAAPQIRNVATVGGNIASAVPCADLPPILIAMNASVRLWSQFGERDVPLHEFFAGPRCTVLQAGEVLTAVFVPRPPPRFGAAYARFALRDGNAIAVAAVAASLLLDRDDTVRDARIVLGAVAPVPRLVEAAAAELRGQPATQDAFARAAEAARDAAQPISDVRGSAAFRRELVAVLSRRALTGAYRRAMEDQAWSSRAG